MASPLIVKYEEDCSEGKYFYKFGEYTPGDRLLIETTFNMICDCIYCETEGTGLHNRIRVHSVREVLFDKRSDNKRHLLFLASEVRSIRLFLPETLPDQIVVSPFYKQISFSRFTACCDLILNFAYFPVVDVQFYAAIKQIVRHDVISVGLLGVDLGKLRAVDICLLMIGTPTKIYLFDLVITPKDFFECGLKSILRNVEIKKILFDGRMIYDVLYNRYWRTEIANSFDLLMADFVILKRDNRLGLFKDFRSLNEITEEYLNLPGSIYANFDLVRTEIMIFNRPLSHFVKCVAALSMAFYFPLYDEINAELNKEFDKKIQKVVDKKFGGINIKRIGNPCDCEEDDKTGDDIDDEELIRSDGYEDLHEYIERLQECILNEIKGGRAKGKKDKKHISLADKIKKMKALKRKEDEDAIEGIKYHKLKDL